MIASAGIYALSRRTPVTSKNVTSKNVTALPTPHPVTVPVRAAA